MLLIYIFKSTARSEYVFEFIFKEQIDISYSVTNDLSDFEDFQGLKINYSNQRLSSGFFINNAGVLPDDSLKKIEVPLAEKQGKKVLFPSNDCDLGFDLFSATFYMLSRYEEYLPFTEDEHGRFPYSESIAYKNDFLETPIIDEGIETLCTLAGIPSKNKKFEAILTYDIDVAYKYLGRDFSRTVGSCLKDLLKLDIKTVWSRLQVLSNFKKDPWDVYNGLRKQLGDHSVKSIFFFLLGDRLGNDRNLDPENQIMQNLVHEISSFTEIGIHPSYASNKSKTKLFGEKERLEFITGKKVTKSRQHYLKLIFPKTYFNLIEAGIVRDYSMGFPDRAGFRAGTCKPFNFYDLKNEAVMKLKIFPITCMEATFIYYEKLPPEKALLKILSLMKTVEHYGGIFISIWHNENLSESGPGKPWKKVHDQMLRQVKSYLKK